MKNTLSFSDCTSGGCGAKLPPSLLSKVISNINQPLVPQLLVGFDSADDAAVYEQPDGTCIISTTDFFSPMVEDPRLFGRIAAANALSDVYAMGGHPIMALNLVCVPQKQSPDILGEILAGGAEKVVEAGAVIAGGHSIYDKETKYGLCVTGLAKKNQIIRNNTPKVGDHLILTKPLGIGIVMAACRVSMANANDFQGAIKQMEQLNRYSVEKCNRFPISACTDVTGFGLLVHLTELCGTRVSAHLFVSEIPSLPNALTYASEYVLTAGGQRNRLHFEGHGSVDQLDFPTQELLFDPQTSGGLLISVPSKFSQTLLRDIHQDDPFARIIGEIIPRKKDTVIFNGGNELR